MWFALDYSDLDFIERAPHRFAHEAEVSGTPERVFEALAGPEFEAWFADMGRFEWKTKEPRGCGSIREVSTSFTKVRERFVAWEPGQRLAFAIDAMSIPLAAQMLEDFQLAKALPGRTLLRWTVYYRPGLLMRLTWPISRPEFGKMFQDSFQRICARLSAEGG
jgi:uncharacterized protein YndB with AHSA1/START domain